MSQSRRAVPAGPVLFLDYDGVLHPDDVWRVPGKGIVLRGGGALFQHADALDCALQPFRDVHIVLSTTWVSELGFSEAKAYLPEGLRARVVGATFHTGHALRWHQQSRYGQIHEHAQRYGLGSRWLAIDDSTKGWPSGRRAQLVSPQSAVGLTALDLGLLADRLRTLTKGVAL